MAKGKPKYRHGDPVVVGADGREIPAKHVESVDDDGEVRLNDSGQTHVQALKDLAATAKAKGQREVFDAVRSELEPYALTNTASRAASIGVDSMPWGKKSGIDPANRSKAIPLSKAARLLGRPDPDSGVEWLKACIEDGTIRAEKLSRQAYVFDRSQFPPEAHHAL